MQQNEEYLGYVKNEEESNIAKILKTKINGTIFLKFV